jgi:L-asparagine transporter-like permease
MREGAPALARRIGPFDATMIVMGGIVGSGIFVTPAIVARAAQSPLLIVGAWVIGGIAALLGAFVYAELSSSRPEVGGQYAYLREAMHPLVAFLYGWALLLVIETGGMAATAITFARYFREVVPVALTDGALAAIAMALLTAINCLGVRAGSSAQSALMMIKICALAALVAAGLFLAALPRLRRTQGERSPAWAPLSSRCCSPTAGGRPPASSRARCATRVAICRARSSPASSVSSCSTRWSRSLACEASARRSSPRAPSPRWT